MKENSDRVSALRAQVRSKRSKIISAFLCRYSFAKSDVIKNPNLGEAGRGKLSSIKKLSQAFLFAYQCRSFKHILVFINGTVPNIGLVM